MPAPIEKKTELKVVFGAMCLGKEGSRLSSVYAEQKV